MKSPILCRITAPRNYDARHQSMPRAGCGEVIGSPSSGRAGAAMSRRDARMTCPTERSTQRPVAHLRIAMTIVVLGALALVGGAVPASASDAVLYWNEVASTAIVPRGPAGFVDLAKVQIAVHDAVQAYEHRFEPYCAPIAGAAGSPSAAVATAAHEVLVALLPAAPLGMTYTAYVSDRGLLDDPGIEVGRQAAACILELREFDGSFPNPALGFLGFASVGVWRSATSMVQPWLGAVEPFALRDSTQLTTPRPRRGSTAASTRATTTR